MVFHIAGPDFWFGNVPYIIDSIVPVQMKKSKHYLFLQNFFQIFKSTFKECP